MFEIAKTDHGYAAPTTLVSFDVGNGAFPEGSLLADAHGDLFGTTSVHGPNGRGTVFEIVNNGTVNAPSYASTPTTLVSFVGPQGGNPTGSLIADAHGDLFGTTFQFGANQYGYGTVFEVAKTANGYASTPTVLAYFNSPTGADGAFPKGSLITDAHGDLFGTTSGGNMFPGTVFEIAKTANGYGPLTTLATFNGHNGYSPDGDLIIDAHGDLFGTTASGGTNNDGTVFEIAKTAHGYAPVTTVLNFTGANGAHPYGSLISDVNGTLFGTTSQGGASGDGTVFAINVTTPITAKGAPAVTTDLHGLDFLAGSGSGADFTFKAHYEMGHTAVNHIMSIIGLSPHGFGFGPDHIG